MRQLSHLDDPTAVQSRSTKQNLVVLTPTQLYAYQFCEQSGSLYGWEGEEKHLYDSH